MDIVILAVGAIAAASVSFLDRWLALAIAFVVGHFFLFCNVLRMSRPPELIWASVFAGLVMLNAVFGALSWPPVFVIASSLTIILAVLESRRPSYHGVMWRWLNPGLPQWWAGHQ